MSDSVTVPIYAREQRLCIDDGSEVNVTPTDDFAYEGNILTNQKFWHEMIVQDAKCICNYLTEKIFRDKVRSISGLLADYGFDKKAIDLVYKKYVTYGYIEWHDQLFEILNPPTFNNWQITDVGSAILLHNAGDFRVMEWELEHIKDGVYYEKPLSYKTVL